MQLLVVLLCFVALASASTPIQVQFCCSVILLLLVSIYCNSYFACACCCHLLLPWVLFLQYIQSTCVMCPSISAASSPCLMLKCVLCCSESYPSCMLLLAYQSLSCSVAQPSSQIRSIRRSRVCPQFHCQISHYLCFILWLVESRRFANRCRHCWCDLCPLGPVRSRFAPRHDQWQFIRRHHHTSSCLPSCSSDLFAFSVWLVWHISRYCQVQDSKARLVFEELMYWFVKTRGICSSTGLWRQYPLVEELIYKTCSRVARFDDIKILDLDVSFSCFFLV